jgi:hypothetical protein
MSERNESNPFYPFPYNATLWEYPEYCTLDTCPLEFAAIDYPPNLAGNAFFATFFGVVLFVQIFLGIRYRTWGFMAGMIWGCACEVVGYAGRIQLHNNIFSGDGFFMYVSGRACHSKLDTDSKS